jgi:hypothetical protein
LYFEENNWSSDYQASCKESPTGSKFVNVWYALVIDDGNDGSSSGLDALIESDKVGQLAGVVCERAISFVSQEAIKGEQFRPKDRDFTPCTSKHKFARRLFKELALKFVAHSLRVLTIIEAIKHVQKHWSYVSTCGPIHRGEVRCRRTFAGVAFLKVITAAPNNCLI